MVLGLPFVLPKGLLFHGLIAGIVIAMRRAVLGATFLMAGALLAAGRPHHAFSDDFTTWKVGGLGFLVPDRWEKEPVEGPARVAQWRIAAPHGQPGEAMEVVVFFFGPGIGGGVKENINAWAGLLQGSDGHPPEADPHTHTVAGHPVTEVLLSGTYAQASSQPGIPPTLKPAYSLLGAVVENPAGNIYWRVTGPAAEIAALEPIFTRILDSLQPQADKP